MGGFLELMLVVSAVIITAQVGGVSGKHHGVLALGYFDDFKCLQQLRRQRDIGYDAATKIGAFTPVNCEKFKKWLRTKGRKFRDCQDILHHKEGRVNSGVYRIHPKPNKGFLVYCDMTTDGGGWTVFQHRESKLVDFYRGWKAYKNGFGNLNGNFWLGNDKLHLLTTQRSYKLRVVLEDFSGNQRFADYAAFSVADEKHRYKLSIGKYKGNAGDSLTHHNGCHFYTKDSDNGHKCANSFKGAWWYKSCHASNLNGLYLKGKTKSYATGMVWNNWLGYHYSLKKSTMMLRTK